MSNSQTSQSSVYQEALQAVETLDPPAVGFLKSGGDSVTISQTKIIKQNNLIIQFLVNISERLENCEECIKSLKATQEKGKAPATEEFSKNLEELTKQLEKVRVSEGIKPTPKASTLYVHRDPYKIFEEEKRKAGGGK